MVRLTKISLKLYLKNSDDSADIEKPKCEMNIFQFLNENFKI